MSSASDRKAYWRSNLKIMGVLLTIWFLVSYGCGIIWVDSLNKIQLGGYKLGFWFAQQGSIFTFVIIILVYVILLNKLDRKYGFDQDTPAEQEIAKQQAKEGEKEWEL